MTYRTSSPKAMSRGKRFSQVLKGMSYLPNDENIFNVKASCM